MSLHHNPRIVTDGLVFAYDMDNPAKSWKGKPTTNLFDNPVFATGTRAPWSYQTTANGDNSIDTSFTYEGFNTAKIVRTSTGGEANYWVNSSSVVSGDINPNTEYTFSAYAYATVANQAALFSYFGTQSSGFAYHPGGGKWVRLAHTFTSRSTSPYVQLRMWSDTTTLNTPVYFTKLQLEEGSFATPWVNGTRSNTQALLDMSKSKNTVTASSLTYNSDGTFEFDNSSSNYVDLPNDIGVTGNTISVFAWFKRNGSPSGGYHIICGGQELEISIPDPNGAIRVGVYSGGTRYVSNHGSGLLDGNWHHIGFTSDGTTKTAYIDGESVGTQSISGTLSSSFSNRRLGRFGSSNTYYANANISIYKIYNRALTAAEIKQNFNATRGRFGI